MTVTEYDNNLLREGILRYTVKEYDAARKYLERALASADDMQTRAQANYYLSLLTDDPVQKRNYLEETLAVDMTHPEARRMLAVLDGRLRSEDIVSPDALPARAAGTAAVQAGRFTCPKCGGRMCFAPDGVSLVCEYCRHDQLLSSTTGSSEQDFFIAMADGSGLRSPVAVQTFRCQGCGAVFILAPDQLSTTCAYCGSAHVVALQEKQQLVEPDSLLAMRLDQQQATGQLVRWMDEMKLAPQVPTPRGLYLPVWSFAIQGSFPWTGTVYRERRQVPISGEKQVHFDDIRILGSRKWAGLMAQALPGFDLSNATAYDPRFLAGWMADVYDLPMAEASLEARRIAVEQLRALIRQESGSINNLGYSTSSLMISAFKLILVPIWVAEIRNGSRSLRVLVNGRTGSVHSEIPVGGLAGWLGKILGVR